MSTTKTNIPSHWQVKRIGEVGKIISGGTPSTSINDYWDGDISWITPADLSHYEDKYISTGRKSITRKGLDNCSAKLMPKGSVLFSSRAPIGYVVIAGSTICTNQGFKSIVPNEEIDNVYLFYFLKSAKQSAERVASGTTFKEISMKAFAQLEIPIPPINEQQAIVAKIEELLSELENGKQQLLTAQQQLKVYRQSLLKAAFEGRLTNKNVNERELPEGWKSIELGKLSQLINGDRGKNYPNRTEYVPKGIPFINTGHIEPTGKLDTNTMHFITREKFDRLNSGKVRFGDLVYCLRGATMGKTARIEQFEEGAIASSLVIVRANEGVFYLYVYYFLISPLGKRYIKRFDNGTAQPNLSAKSLSLFSVPIPPYNEQEQIVEQLERKLTVCDKLEETITNNLKQTETLKQSILKRAFEGRLVATGLKTKKKN